MKKLFLLLLGAAILAVVVLVGATHHSFHPAAQPIAPTQAPITKLRVANTEVALAERLKAAKEISTDLTNTELKQLLAFLMKPVNERTREEDFLAINEVMNQLRVSGMVCGEYANALCSLIRNPETHPVVRDYAIQHASAWMKEVCEENSPVQLSEVDRKHLLDCIVSFLQEPSSLHETGYGTTLNVLRSLELNYPQDMKDIFTQCSPRIFNVASAKESSPLSNRVSAIQSLPSLPDRKMAQGLVRSMVMDSPIGSPVKLVAIATLGELGDSGDLETLRQIQQSDSRLVYAAQSAAARLEISLNSASR